MNAKRDVMREIEARINKKNLLSKKIENHKKTVVNMVVDFFTEYEKVKNMDRGSSFGIFETLVISKLENELRYLDPKCNISFKKADDGNTIEIYWSPAFIKANNCEEVLALDESSACFQKTIDEII